MRIISEKTKKEYKTVEECLAAEAEFDALQEQKRLEAEKKAEERKTRAKEVEDAYKAKVEADQKFVDLRNKFIKDYGSFHMTYSTAENPLNLQDLMEALFCF